MPSPIGVDYTFIIQLVIFLIFVLFIKEYLFLPIIKRILNRKRQYVEMKQGAIKISKDTSQIKNLYKVFLNTLYEEREKKIFNLKKKLSQHRITMIGKLTSNVFDKFRNNIQHYKEEQMVIKEYLQKSGKKLFNKYLGDILK